MKLARTSRVLLAALLAISATSAVQAQAPNLERMLNETFEYRALGPYRTGSWISDIAVPETPPAAHASTIYASARHGGVWKSTNNGATWRPIFDDTGVFAVGCVEVAPSDANVIWVGTGDNSCARSANPGNGVYKSTDAGESFQHMGLPESHHVHRIVIHPTNPDVVYVAAMGHLFSRNEERGVFKTTDGGRTWQKVLYVDDTTGAVDLVLDRSHPDTLYAVTYQVLRHPWVILDGGPGSGIHKTTDGGRTWRKLGGGLPTGEVGRIGLDLYQKDPRILYAVVDNRNMRADGSDQIQGEVYKSEDAGESWQMTIADGHDPSGKAGYSFNQLWIDPNDPNRVIITGASYSMSIDGGKTWGAGGGRGARGGEGGGGGYRLFGRAFGDFRTLWIDPQDSNRMISGSDGGVYLSYDSGRTCIHLDNLPLGEVYALGVDMENPYNIYVGLQDHESWKAPSNGWQGRIGVENWESVGTGDGMYNRVDPTDSRWLYNNQELGSLARVDQRLRTRTNVAPGRNGRGGVRFNWTSPIEISPHDPKTIYTGGQVVYRSRDRGDTWEEMSPDLTSNNPEKINLPAIQYCTVITMSESPKQTGVFWAGSDDGLVHVTRDDGRNWTDATPKLIAAGALADSWVTRVFASRHAAGTAYVTLSRLRQDDFRPFIYKTTDFGATWKAIQSNMPEGSVNAFAEDPVNPNLLFAGSNSGVYVSIDGGAGWSSLRGNMPPAPVHDMVIHPREGDLVVGTYARNTWVTNIIPLRELTADALAQPAFLFTPPAKGRRVEGVWGNYRLYGDKVLTSPNEPNGIVFTYYVKDAEPDGATITIVNQQGQQVASLNGPARAGLNQVTWNLAGGGGGRGRGAAAGRRGARGARGATTEAAAGAALGQRRGAAVGAAAGAALGEDDQARGAAAGRRGARRGGLAGGAAAGQRGGGGTAPPAPGEYRATLAVGAATMEKPVRVLEPTIAHGGDANLGDGNAPEAQYDE